MKDHPTSHKVAAVAWLLISMLLIGCSDNASEDTPDAGSTVDTGPDMREDAADASDPGLLALSVDEPGPYNTGYRTIEHTYEVSPGESRQILVNIWYPTEEIEGTSARYLGVIRDSDSFADASLAQSPWSDGRFPVQVYSHGDQGFGGTAAQLMRHFASHGWVSIAPDHTGNTLDNNLDPRPPAMRIWRSLDISASIDAASQLTGEFEGVLRTDQVFMSGHSFGGFTVWASAGASFDSGAVSTQCQLDAMPLCTPEEVGIFESGVVDSRLVAAMTIAGNYREAWFGNDGFETVDIPVFALSGTADPRGHAEEFELIDGVDLTWVDVEGACHESFTFGGGCTTIETEEAFTIVDAYALAMARHYVLSDESLEVLNLLSGETFPNEKVETFRAK